MRIIPQRARVEAGKSGVSYITLAWETLRVVVVEGVTNFKFKIYFTWPLLTRFANGLNTECERKGIKDVLSSKGQPKTWPNNNKKPVRTLHSLDEEDRQGNMDIVSQPSKYMSIYYVSGTLLGVNRRVQNSWPGRTHSGVKICPYLLLP